MAGGKGFADSAERRNCPAEEKGNCRSSKTSDRWLLRELQRSKREGYRADKVFASTDSSDEIGKRRRTSLRLGMMNLEGLHGNELPSTLIFPRRVRRVVDLLDTENSCSL